MHLLVIEEYVENILNHIPFISKEPNFTLEELIKAIKALKCNKAAGPDRIPAEMIKSSSEPILKILLVLYIVTMTYVC